MAVSLKHAFVNPVADLGDPNQVGPDEWNDEHVLTLGTDKLLGRDTAGTGAVEEIGLGASLAFSGSATIGVAADGVSNAMLENMAESTIKGRAAGAGTGDPTDLSASQVRALLDLEIGTDVQAYDADLAALAANSTDGLWAHTGAGTGAARTIMGTANEVSVANGDGVSANPTISLPTALTLTGKTLTGGTFSGPTITLTDANFTLQDDADPTRQAQFSLGSITSGMTRTYTLPNNSTTVVGTASTQTLTNKTLSLSTNTLTGTLAEFDAACSDADFLSVAAAAAAYQPLDSDLTAIAALTTTAAGRSVLAIADPNADRILAWDDTAGAMVAIALADITAEAAPATGDYVLIYGAEGDLRKVDWSDLPGAGGGIASVVEDTSPQLGGMLDVNAQAIGDGTRELLTFVEDASAVNHVEIENQATGGGPIIRAAGDDTDIDLILAGKGTGVPKIGSNAIIDAGDTASDSAAGIVELAVASEVNTGTDTGRAITPDALAGSNYGKSIVPILVFDDSQNCATGDGAGDVFFTVPAELNGFNLVGVTAACQTAGTTGTMDVQVRNVTQTADMLTTKVTIDSGEKHSKDAATPAVIDTGNDDVATGDEIRIDVDAVHTTPAKGLLVNLIFQLP